MIQHINLLTTARRQRNFVWVAYLGLIALVLWLAWTAGANEWHLRNLQEAEAKTQQSLAELKVALEKKRREAGLEDKEAMARQTQLLRSQIDARRGWADLLQKGELGSPQGYSQVLETLAELREEGVWLQGVDIAKGGQSLVINGKSLTASAVMRYIDQINEAFKPMGIQFSSIEISREAPSGDAAGVAKAGILKFKIS